jgi:hypothetical protein
MNDKNLFMVDKMYNRKMVLIGQGEISLDCFPFPFSKIPSSDLSLTPLH